jgi:pimeloyl-ACP methyl ester carboxylesterase
MKQRSLAALGARGFHNIAYTEWGEAGRPAVVCVHGLTRNSRDFDALAAALAADRRVACPDMPGRGRSDWLADPAEYGYPRYLSDIAALVARLDVDRVDWVGTSMGGLIGMMLAATPGSPIRRLVLNDVGPFIPRASLERLRTYVGQDPAFADEAELEAYLRRVHAPFGPLDDEEWRHFVAHGQRRDAEGALRLGYDPAIGRIFAGELRDIDLWAMWECISCPVLVLRGASSDLLTADTAAAMTARGPRAELVTIPGVGHAPALMAPDQIAIVREWLGAA